MTYKLVQHFGHVVKFGSIGIAALVSFYDSELIHASCTFDFRRDCGTP